ncbi:hypothetical protein [Methylocaldum gracile]|jgi:hypothetical protein|uniref:hypothetical protein n=1 Tax=unclassified Methylocaldum TaxID=2622260 RepID=UPI001062060B
MVADVGVDEYLERFDPYRDAADWVSEDRLAYAERMQRNFLPTWPTEVLVEWFYRHARHLHDYAFLKFERFAFERQRWPTEKFPGREAFADPRFCDDFRDVVWRAQQPYDWLAKHMLAHGTWNTPIVLLATPARGIVAPGGWELRYPLHLLEGHRRLSFLTGLRELGKAAPEHDVWLVHLEG